MKERPILFKPPMVRAIIDGEKTQTRREVKGIRVEGLLPELVKSICPFGKVGDRLWVRETWTIVEKKFDPVVSVVRYKADGDWLEAGGRWRPSIFMPKAACRLWLEITGVRVEKLWEIDDLDAVAEGVSSATEFCTLWARINGAESWQDNPFVWVVNFKIYKLTV